MKIRPFLLIALIALPAGALEIKRNDSPIYINDPIMVKEIDNARLETAGEGDDQVNVLHVWGSAFEMGKAAGTLLKEPMSEYCDLVLGMMTREIEGGLDVLDQVAAMTKPYTPPHFFEEIKGLSAGSGIDEKTLLRVNLIGEATEWHCSLFGAWGDATRSTGSLIQLRALDYAVRAEIQRYPVVMVYHPDEGHAFANFTWAGIVGSISGISSEQLAISEIGDDYDKENDSFEGYPFMFMLRDILQFDTSLDEAVARVKKGPRTTSLMYAIGDGEFGQSRALQTSRTLCNVYDPGNLEPLTETHQRIKDIVYWGMSWNVPKYEKPLHDMLENNYGAITPEVTIREILPTVRTGNLQVVIYDLTNMICYYANARANGEAGPLEAYNRPFIRLDMNKLFSAAKPKGA
ncbi:MAG: hypothetical protein GC154_11630 [bacterium]|nr:hypothetical protein [bacterium]